MKQNFVWTAICAAVFVFLAVMLATVGWQQEDKMLLSMSKTYVGVAIALAVLSLREDK